MFIDYDVQKYETKFIYLLSMQLIALDPIDFNEKMKIVL